MNVLITGANGFIGRGIAERLIRQPFLNHYPIRKLILVDKEFHQPFSFSSPDKGLSVQYAEGDISDQHWM